MQAKSKNCKDVFDRIFSETQAESISTSHVSIQDTGETKVESDSVSDFSMNESLHFCEPSPTSFDLYDIFLDESFDESRLTKSSMDLFDDMFCNTISSNNGDDASIAFPDSILNESFDLVENNNNEIQPDIFDNEHSIDLFAQSPNTLKTQSGMSEGLSFFDVSMDYKVESEDIDIL